MGITTILRAGMEDAVSRSKFDAISIGGDKVTLEELESTGKRTLLIWKDGEIEKRYTLEEEQV